MSKPVQARVSDSPSAMRFTINLASARPGVEGALRLGLSLAALVLLGLAAAQAVAWQRGVRRLGELEAGIRRVETAASRLTIRPGTPGLAGLAGATLEAPIEAKVATINGLIARKAFSWTGFLTDLEEAVPPRISIHRITPRWQEGRPENLVDLAGEAASLQDLAALIMALEQAPQFGEAFLTHQRMRPEDTGVVGFSLHVRYVPAAGGGQS